MIRPLGRTKRGSLRAPGKERAIPRVGPLLGAPPPITFRTPKQTAPNHDAPELAYKVLQQCPGGQHAILELATDGPVSIPDMDVVCCVSGVSLARVDAMQLEGTHEVRFAIPDVPGNIRLQTRDADDASIQVNHPPVQMRSFGVERMRSQRRVTRPKLPPFAGFRPR